MSDYFSYIITSYAAALIVMGYYCLSLIQRHRRIVRQLQTEQQNVNQT